MSSSTLLRGLLLFWAAWCGVVTLSNAADALVAMGALPANFAFASGNYPLIARVTSRYPRPDALVPVLFAGVIAWEALATTLFARAFVRWPRLDAHTRVGGARTAYAVAVALWATFLVLDELLIAYDMQSSHIHLLIAHLACLVVTEILPTRT